MCEREREGKRDKKTEREREGQRTHRETGTKKDINSKLRVLDDNMFQVKW